MNIRRMRGVGLIEVLVAVLVLSIGLLGLAQLQVTALKATHAAALRLEAVTLAGDLLERLRARHAPAVTGAGPAAAGADLAEWQAVLAQRLPAGEGELVLAGDVATIRVRWQAGRDADPAVVQLRTRL